MLRGLPRLIAVVAVLALAGCAVPVHGQIVGRYRDWRQTAYDNGYREGVRHGEADARSGRSFDYGRDGVYRDGDDGYGRGYGDRDDYRRVFRQGYSAGYSDGYSRGRAVVRPGYPYPDGRYDGGRYGTRDGSGYGNYAARDRAFDNGYKDGYDKGSDDARHRRAPDVLRHSRYRSGDHGYGSWYGPRREYENRYRDGFRRGYDEAYRNGRIW